VEDLRPSTALTRLAANENARVCRPRRFQAEDMAVLHLLRASRIPEVPVLFWIPAITSRKPTNTVTNGEGFASLHLVQRPPTQQRSAETRVQHSAFLYQTDPTRCCQLRKSRASARRTGALRCLVTGLAARTVPERKNLKKVELHPFNPPASPVWSEASSQTGIGNRFGAT